MKKIKILGQFDYQTFPETDDMIEVDENVLSEIGKTKCFDTINKTVIDYDNSNNTRKEELQRQINHYKSLLFESDYRAIKYAEGIYTEEEYAPYRAERQLYRDEINAFEAELKKLGGE